MKENPFKVAQIDISIRTKSGFWIRQVRQASFLFLFSSVSSSPPRSI